MEKHSGQATWLGSTTLHQNANREDPQIHGHQGPGVGSLSGMVCGEDRKTPRRGGKAT